MTAYHLAQLNIGRMAAPLDSPIMSGFMNGLERINALAEQTPGFIWRLTTPAGDATALRPYEDDRMIVNMSVWESIDALYRYVYFSDHTDFYRQRAQWFARMDTPSFVMWWIPTGHLPTIEQAKAKLDTLEKHGSTREAFHFKARFDSPEKENL